MSFVGFLEEFVDRKISEIQQGMICKIDKFDKKKMKADVKPLYKETNEIDEEVDLPVIPDIPVMFIKCGDYYIRPDYKKDDLVWVGFATYDIEDALCEDEKSLSKKMNNLENACVLGGIAKTDWQNPDNFDNDGLLIGHKDGTMYINLTDSNIDIKCSKFSIDADNIEFKGNFKVNDTGLEIN